jgi:Putative zinc-finger/FecR protein
MNCDNMENRLHDYVDGVLTPGERQEVERHLETCANCRQEMQFLQALRQQVARLPQRLDPPRDLWPEIAARIEPKPRMWEAWLAELRTRQNGAASHFKKIFWGDSVGIGKWLAWGMRGGMAVAMLVLLVGGICFLLKTPQTSWEVARLAGTPQIGAERIDASGKLAVGEWLETDDSSRAQIDIGVIGHVEIAPNTRIRLVKAKLTDHRLALARGEMHAEIFAPPKIFFVETSSALAVDLGCEYTLKIDEDGFGRLHVTRGYVALENEHGPESTVPAGAFCEIRPNMAPGTPYSEDATAAFRTTLNRFDLAHDDTAALSIVLAEAREADTFTLWHLLFRVSATERAGVYDRMAALLPPPAGVTREGVLRGDKRMLDLWAEMFGIGKSWWRYWLPL